MWAGLNGLVVSALRPPEANSTVSVLPRISGAACPHHGDRGGVPPDLQVRIDRRVLRGRHVLRVEHVLHAPGNAVDAAFRRQLVELAGGAEGAVGVQMEPCLDHRVARFDAGGQERSSSSAESLPLRSRAEASAAVNWKGWVAVAAPER